jgi:uroporphyrinogen-III synthase
VRVVVTRPAVQAGELAAAIRARGHEPVLCPVIEIEPLGDDPIDVGGYDWVVVTSANGARELLRRARRPWPRVAAIGPGTARALSDGGVESALVPRVSTQEGLLTELPRPAGRVLLAAAEDARTLLVHELGADFVALYRTVELPPPVAPEGDLVVLASASAARAWARGGGRLPAVSIGPQTTAAAVAAGIDVVAEAPTHDLAGLVAALEQAAR